MSTSRPSSAPPSHLCAHFRAPSRARAALLAYGAPLALSALAWGGAYAQEATQEATGAQPQQGAQKEPQRVMDVAPLPKTRGFWGTFFFWSGGVFAMYLVGRRVFREQSHERLTLKLFESKIGPFFPEFLPMNLRKWLDLAAPHLFAGWRSGDFSTMESFCEPAFLERERAKSEALRAEGRRRVAHLGAVLNMHPLGAFLVEGEGVPPKGVELQLRVELKVIDYLEGAEGLLVGKKKDQQVQQLWILRHNGASWRVHDISLLEGDVLGLDERPPLPPIMSWERPKGVRVTTELSSAKLAPKSLPPLTLSPEPAHDETNA